MIQSIHIHANVKVKLSPAGLDIMRGIYDALPLSVKDNHSFEAHINVDSDGYSIFQMWSLMAIFGPHTYPGGPAPFDGDIIIIGNKKETS